MLFLCYIFLLIFSLYSDCGCSRFSLCYDSFSFLCFCLVLKILFRCLGWLPAPTVFLLLPIFFSFRERSPDRGCRRLQFSFCLDCDHELLGKSVSFWYLHLRTEIYVSTRMHVRSSRGAEGAGWGGDKDDSGVGVYPDLMFLF